MSLALIFEHFEFKGRVCWVIEVVLHILACQVSQALFKASGTLVEHAQLLFAKAHVVHREKEDELVMLVLRRLNLLEQLLGILKEN